MDGTYDDTSAETLSLSEGTIEYRDIDLDDTDSDPGSGADSDPDSRRADVVLFVHGALVNGDLWRGVVGRLADRSAGSARRCLMPTLPLGGHTRAMDANADLTPPE